MIYIRIAVCRWHPSTFHCRTPKKKHGHRAQAIRGDAVLEERYCDAFCSAVRANATPIDLDGHAEHIVHAMLKASGITEELDKQPRKPWISQSTFDLFSARDAARQCRDEPEVRG